jgi:hypothetical protein
MFTPKEGVEVDLGATAVEEVLPAVGGGDEAEGPSRSRAS